MIGMAGIVARRLAGCVLQGLGLSWVSRARDGGGPDGLRHRASPGDRKNRRSEGGSSTRMPAGWPTSQLGEAPQARVAPAPFALAPAALAQPYRASAQCGVPE